MFHFKWQPIYFEAKRTTSFSKPWIEKLKKDVAKQNASVGVLVTETMNNVSLGDRIISRDLITFVRSRNVQFTAQGVKPLTRVYAFFDGREVSRFCVPKLLQISMTNGAFQSGETVIGRGP